MKLAIDSRVENGVTIEEYFVDDILATKQEYSDARILFKEKAAKTLADGLNIARDSNAKRSKALDSKRKALADKLGITAEELQLLVK